MFEAAVVVVAAGAVLLGVINVPPKYFPIIFRYVKLYGGAAGVKPFTLGFISWAGSTPVPSPHSLKVSINLKCTFAEASFWTELSNWVTSLPSLGDDSVYFQNPGLALAE